MTRAAVYIVGLSSMVAVTVVTFISINTPNWLIWSTVAPSGHRHTRTIGLHRSCTSTTPTSDHFLFQTHHDLHSSPTSFTTTTTTHCVHFPRPDDCHGADRGFCSVWRTAGFLTTLAATLDLVAIVAFAVVILGGPRKRVHGWKVLVGLVGLAAAAQGVAMAMVLYLFDHDDHFFTGWTRGPGMLLCIVGWCLATLTAVALGLSAVLLPAEAQYDLVPSEAPRD